jgi:hypothetical protein
MVCLCWLAGCTLQSEVILPDANAAGDPIVAFPSDAAFKLESFDRQKNAFHYLGLMTPEKVDGGLIRYKFVFNGDSKTVQLQAKKLSDNNYVLRYAELGGAGQPNIYDGAIMFVTVENGTYYALMSLADKTLFNKVFDAPSRPVVDNDTVKFATEQQGIYLSSYFAKHRDQFLADQDYVRIRVMK